MTAVRVATLRPAAGAILFSLVLAACAASSGSGGIGVAQGFNVVGYEPGSRERAPGVSGPAVAEGAPPIPAGFTTGSLTVVNMWGSWCGPCRREQAELEALWKEYEPLGVVFVGVNTRRDQLAAARAYLEEFAVTYPSVYDPSSEIAHAFGVRAMPSTYVIDASGGIAAVIVGALRDEGDLRAILDTELST